MKYLSTLIITNSILAANNRGEGEGNIQTLQKIHTPKGMRTVISGPAIRRAVRDSMQETGAKMWRISIPNPDADNPAGYLYDNGTGNRVVYMSDATPASADLYDDTLAFGYFSSPKGKPGQVVKRVSAVEVSSAVSTTPYDNDQAFLQGLKANGKINPVIVERHYTRYHYVVNMNLNDMKERPQAAHFVINALHSLRVGGSHASNATSLSPDTILWRFHDDPGCGGLYIGMLDANPDEPVNITPLQDHCNNLGITFEIAGKGLSKTVDAGIKEIVAALSMILGADK